MDTLRHAGLFGQWTTMMHAWLCGLLMYALFCSLLTPRSVAFLSMQAPEIVAGKGHGKGVDWWTLGIFIYEMLASYPPFYDEDPMKTYAKIMQGTINFPSHFSKEAVSLIKKLLQHKPTKRLGVVNGGAAEIKKHPWFKNFDFDALIQRKLKPTIVPKIKNALDTSNFDEYPDEAANIENYVDDGSNWEAEF
jgi:protein kinase A